MEKAQATENTIEVFENDIQMYLSLYFEEQGIEDIRAASQSVWNSALYYIYRHVFKGTDKLKSKRLYIDNNNPIPSNHNSYDYDMVLKVLDIYIYDMCMRYDKEISVIGFSTLTGIERETLYSWGRDSNDMLSSTSSDVFKKLYEFREESLSNKLATANKNPVGILAILNRHYQWNLPGVSRETTKDRALTAAELPKLSGELSDNMAQIPEIEASKTSLELCIKHDNLESQ